MRIVTTSEDLTKLASASTSDFVAVDTEFMREQTFWPQLCLIQLAGPEDDASSTRCARASTCSRSGS